MTLAIVTGTSSGIGLHTAVGLAQSGIEVVATVRDASRADALRAAASDAGVELDIRSLDVTDAAAARALVDAVDRVDILINNAGRGAVGTLEQLTDADLQEQLETNYLSVARLTRLVLPGMRERRNGRIVTVTSVGGAVGQPFADAYCGAKFAVEGLMQSLAPVVAPFGVEVSIVEPAAVASSFTESAHRAPAGPYASQQQAYLDRAARSFASAQSAEDAAKTVVEAATTSAPRFRWQTSEAAARFASLSLADLDGARVLGVTSGWVRSGE
ncbi:SDR family NAD(P)-dependent oxidoreductase [Microbacterium sp. VKM Ac-2923]|uniref:SDR family NAD(P)-dependent oxidoreductase n=1 Tax=Microbacterium sp. VKM Ac-2923 TaxID=2929476 RepID=UPI001FB4727A|nr:SDR family NAD(P)-dependent oxidoreductase [Microbacterium sp. VKM Ac-2923]MCJ1707290.1 SDR family NAD(P)-dependent oxidoreductase [Microbacterium sp. VKM Ac-2923]